MKVSKEWLESLPEAIDYAQSIYFEFFHFKDRAVDSISIEEREVIIRGNYGGGFASSDFSYEFPIEYLSMTFEEIRVKIKEKEEEDKEQSRKWELGRKRDELARLKEYLPKYDTAKAECLTTIKTLEEELSNGSNKG